MQSQVLMGETKMWGVSGAMSLLVPYSHAPCGQWHSLSSHLAAGGDEHQWDTLGRSCMSLAAGSKLLNILSFQVLFRCACLWASTKQKSKLALSAKTVPSTLRHNCLSGFGGFGSSGVTGGEEGREAKRIQVTLCFQAAIRSHWSKGPYPCTEYTLTPWHIQVSVPPVPHPIPSHACCLCLALKTGQQMEASQYSFVQCSSYTPRFYFIYDTQTLVSICWN